jgi:hypothetical protein
MKLQLEDYDLKSYGFVVSRSSVDEVTFAIVSFTSRMTLSPPDSYVLEALRDAITSWVKNTEEGKEFWENSSHESNIGDLDSWGVPPCVKKHLEEKGIFDFDIEVYSHDNHDNAYNWVYDSVLVNGEVE